MFIGLLSFSSSLVTKCLPLNSEPCRIKPTLIDLNPIDLNYYPFMVSLDKCSGDCNASNDLSTKICVSRKTKDVNVEAFNLITKIHEAENNSKTYRIYKMEYIFIVFLVIIIVLFIITFICHYYTNTSKQKHVGTLII